MSEKPKISWRLPPVASATAALAQFCRCIEPTRLVSVTLGLLLLTAATFKGYQLLLGASGDTLVHAPVWLTALLIPAEVLLGLWLLSGRWPLGAWKVALTVFSAFACYALFILVRGDVSCGCLGRLEVDPRWMLAVDLLAVTMLVAFGPTRQSDGARMLYESPKPTTTKACPLPRCFNVIPISVAWVILGIVTACGTFASLGALAAFGVVTDPSWVGSAVDSASPVVCRDRIWDFGVINHGSPRLLSHQFMLENVSKETVSIVKVRSECGCVVTNNPPKELDSNSTTKLEINVDTAGQIGPFQKQVHVLLGTTPASKLTLVVRGHVGPRNGLYAIPQHLDFGQIPRNGTRMRKVRVMRYDGSTVGGLNVATNKVPLHSSHIELTNNGKIAEVSIAVSEQIAISSFSDHLSISTLDSPPISIVIPIRGSIPSPTDDFVSSLYVASLPPALETTIPLLKQDVGEQHVRIARLSYEGDPELRIHLVNSTHAEATVLVDSGATIGNLYSGSLAVYFYPTDSRGNVTSIQEGRVTLPVLVYCGHGE